MRQIAAETDHDGTASLFVVLVTVIATVHLRIASPHSPLAVLTLSARALVLWLGAGSIASSIDGRSIDSRL